MPVQIFRNEKFITTHENIIFDELIIRLNEQWKDSSELIILLGNFSCRGSQIDALVVKKDSISIIDFKNYGGEIIFSENNNWKAAGEYIKMLNPLNPYLQIMKYKNELEKHLKTKIILHKNNETKFRHISGIALFHQKIVFEKSSIPPKIASWFHVTDIYNATNLIYNITSTEINLSDAEILKFPESLALEHYEFQKPKIAIIEEDLINRKELICELYKLLDIHNGIEIAKNEISKAVRSQNEFVKYYYPDWKPESEISYNLNHFHKKYETKQNDFIQVQNDLLKHQINVIYNLNSNNGFVLNNFIHDQDFNVAFSSNNKTLQIIQNVQQNYNIGYSHSILGISTLLAISDIFYERGIFHEQAFRYIRKEINKKEHLVQTLHGLYVVLQLWFSEDMILQHEFSTSSNTKTNEVTPYIKEYKFASGISPKWYTNMMLIFKEQEIVEYDEMFNDTHTFHDSITNEIHSYTTFKYIAKVKLPSEISALFKALRKELSVILNNEELFVLLNLMGLSWIGEEDIDVRKLYILNLRTHFIFSNYTDNEYLKKTSKYPNGFFYEPFYLTCMEQIGQWGWSNNIINPSIFENSYKCLSADYVHQIDNLLSKWSPYKPRYQKNVYPTSNFIKIGDVSKECRTSSEVLVEFLDSIGKKYSDKLVFVSSPDDLQANYDYKILLKKFKTLSFDGAKQPPKTSNPNDQVIIGYDDIKQYIVKRLEPYKNPEESKRFGLSPIAGIMLYGPPGCGKTYWANWIAKYLTLSMEEIPRSLFGSSFVDGAMIGLENKLNEIEKISPVAIFFDEFDSIGRARENSSGSNDESRKVVNTLLQRIPKLLEKGVVILAATNFINDLDSALIRPGRFDLHIPIFPPLPLERAEIIIHYLCGNSSQAILQILTNNSAAVSEFWLKYTESMFLFSNSHMLDFCNELKDFMFSQSKTTEIEDIILTENNILQIANTIKSKIRSMDVKLYKRFYDESQNLISTFKERMDRLKFEIEQFHTDNNEYRPVGFKLN